MVDVVAAVIDAKERMADMIAEILWSISYFDGFLQVQGFFWFFDGSEVS